MTRDPELPALALLAGLAASMVLGCDAVGGDQHSGAGMEVADGRAGTAADAGVNEDAGEVFACLGGRGIRADSVGSNAQGPQPLCSNLNAEAQCVANKAQSEADRSCRSDRDCVQIGARPSCVDACGSGSGGVVSNAGAKAIAETIESLNSTVCMRFDDAGCVYVPFSCPPAGPGDPICSNGECELLTGCPLATHRSSPVLEATLPALAEGCASDDDCKVELPSACPWSCPNAPAFVANAHAAEFSQLLQALKQTCDSATLGGQCAVPPCEPLSPIEATCQSGTCVAR